MHRDHARYEAESSRGVCNKRFVTELQEQRIGPEEAIESASRRFGVPYGAARLFVLSHPAWARAEDRPDEWCERMAGSMRSWSRDRSMPDGVAI